MLASGLWPVNTERAELETGTTDPPRPPGREPLMRRPTPLARTVDLDRLRNATEDRAAARFHPSYAASLARLPAGRQVFHGLPFDLGPAIDAARWILLGG